MSKPLDPRALRNRLGLNQGEFWSRVGITQSGGSRYENGRAIPKPVLALIELFYESEKKAEKVLSKGRGKSVQITTLAS